MGFFFTSSGNAVVFRWLFLCSELNVALYWNGCLLVVKQLVSNSEMVVPVQSNSNCCFRAGKLLLPSSKTAVSVHYNSYIFALQCYVVNVCSNPEIW